MCDTWTLMVEEVVVSGTSVYFDETTRHYIPESSNLDIHSRESMDYHVLDFANKTFN
jgi:hypothetical protein